MSYFLDVDIGSVNAKLALIDENGEVVEFDTGKVISSPRAAASTLIARLGEKFNLKEVVAAGVAGEGKRCHGGQVLTNWEGPYRIISN